MAGACAWRLAAVAAAVAAAAGADAAKLSPRRVKLEAGMTWANVAWGYKVGGNDDIDGAKAVNLDPDFYNAKQVQELHSKGHIVTCYISVGTSENFRSDYKENQEAWDAVTLGVMSNWDEEKWLDISRPDELMALMRPRFLRAQAIGCDAVEPDNMACYSESECYKQIAGYSKKEVFGLQVDYMLKLADLAHALGLSIIHKNAVELVPKLYDVFDGSITENCVHWKECGDYEKYYHNNGKAHWAVEYYSYSDICTEAYDGMLLKYCEGNKGGYLCTDNKYSSCFAPLKKLPPTTFTKGSAGPVKPSPDDDLSSTPSPTAAPEPREEEDEEGEGEHVPVKGKLRLACTDKSQGGLHRLPSLTTKKSTVSLRRKLKNKSDQAISTCYLIAGASKNHPLSLTIKAASLGAGTEMRVYSTKKVKANKFAVKAALLEDYTSEDVKGSTKTWEKTTELDSQDGDALLVVIDSDSGDAADIRLQYSGQVKQALKC